MSLMTFEIHGPMVAVKVATSIKKDGSLRYRESSGVGGNPEGARGSEIHFSKLQMLADHFSRQTGDDWELKSLIYIINPRQYYGLLTNGVDELCYQYITTNAPGSGQQYAFSPLISKKRIPFQRFHASLGAAMIKHKFTMDYLDIHWKDADLMVDIINQGVTPDMVESTLALVR